MGRITIVILCVLIAGCRLSDKSGSDVAVLAPNPKDFIEDGKRNIPVYDFEGLLPLLQQDNGKTYVVNFWATWCAPCVKELPYFEQLNTEQKKNNVQVILVNLDMPTMWKSKLLPFIGKHELKSQVVVLDDPKQNTWIPLVDQDWSGAIPATLIYNGNKRIFYEQPFTYEELSLQLKKFTTL